MAGAQAIDHRFGQGGSRHRPMFTVRLPDFTSRQTARALQAKRVCHPVPKESDIDENRRSDHVARRMLRSSPVNTMQGQGRLLWAVASVLGLIAGCGITRDTGAANPGDPSQDASAQTGTGGAGGSGGVMPSGGSPVTTGGSTTVGKGGASFTGGAGGTGGVPCLGDDGKMRQSLKVCNVDGDCTTIALKSCCSALIAGIARGKTCSNEAQQTCPLTPCPPIADTAEDGTSTDQGTVEARCARVGDGGSGVCRTVVVQHAAEIPCGAATCAAGSICVHPATSLGGPAPMCVAPLDGGACPAGTSMQPFCGGHPGGGCVLTYVPPPPACIPTPPGCTAGLTCACVPSYVCGGGANVCQTATGRDVYCVNEAP
jgi:hypothetical protein